jgi:N-acetylglutamate synthase-like GNAT family acetyltransferase
LHHVVKDVKLLARLGVKTALFHNMTDRFANRKAFAELRARLPGTRIHRIPPGDDFYRRVLDTEAYVFKLIFLERKFLVDAEGRRINAVTTSGARQRLDVLVSAIGNAHLKGLIEGVCERIDAGRCDRVHILPAGKNAIKNELFSIEGSGTLIANDFEEVFRDMADERERKVVSAILDRYKRLGYIKHRSRRYLQDHRDRFHITLIDGIIVGCVEGIPLDEETVELGALAIATKFRNQRVGVFTVKAFVEEMARRGFSRVVSLTNNPRLQSLYDGLGFRRESPSRYAERQAASPGVAMFHRKIP